MRVHHAADIRARPHQLGVDRVLGVPPPLSLEHLAVPRDEDHLLRADLLEPERRGLHPDAAAVGIAGGDVSPHEIALVLQREDAAAERDLLA